MSQQGLHIAWLGPVPAENSGAAGVATELLEGLADRGHRIDCFLPASPGELPARIDDNPNLQFVWAETKWKWGQWYSRTPLRAFVTGLGVRAIAFYRLRSAIVRQHADDPYDLIYQFSNIETFGIPQVLAKSVPIVLHPQTHIAGELRWFLAERRLALRCQPWYRVAFVGVVLAIRTVVQRVTIHRADLLICISEVFRDHLISDYDFPRSATVIVPNPVKLARFRDIKASVGQSPTAVVIGRIAVRKGVEQVVALSHLLKQRGVVIHLRIIGGHSQWSDYRPLLGAVEPTNTTYVGSVAPDEIPEELKHSDMLIQASKYEPFGLTVAEAFAAGVPVIATSEVGAIEGSSDSSALKTPVGDPEALADAVETMVERLQGDAKEVRRAARADAQRLFAPDVVCQRISEALESLVTRGGHPPDSNGGRE